MYDLAEKIALDDFDKLDKHHKFSDTYTHKKKLFMEEVKMKSGQSPVKRKKNRILIAAACLLICIPTTAFAAVKVYNMVVQKHNYEVNVSVTNDTPKKNDWYKLEVNYLPENMVKIESAPMKYSFKDNYSMGGFSFYLWRVGKNSNFQTLYTKSYEEKEINGKKAVIVNKDTGNKSIVFDRKVYLLFEEEGIMVDAEIGNDVSEELMIKVMENISLEPTSKEMSSFIADFDDPLYSEEDEPIEFSVIPLKKDSKQLFSVGEKVPVTLDQISRLDNLEFVIEKVEIFDSITDFKQNNFNGVGLRSLSWYKALDQKKILLPYRRDIYKVGNGKDSNYELVESKLVAPKFVYLTTTVKNIGKEATEEIYMRPTIKVLKNKNNAWHYAGEDGIDEKSIMTGEVDYLAPHGNGKAFYNIGNIQPGQTINMNLGYFVDEDKLDSIFLDVFGDYSDSSFNGSENMNAKDRWWIDIRKYENDRNKK